MPYSTTSSGGYSGYYSGYNPSSPVLSSSNSRRTNLYNSTASNNNNSVFDRLSPTASNNRTQSTSGNTRTGASSRFSGATGSTFNNNNISSSSPSSSPTQRVSSASVTKRSNLLGGGGGNALRTSNNTNYNNNNNTGQKTSSNAILSNLRGGGMSNTATSNNININPTLPLSHTIGRVQDRNKLGLIEKDNYGHSPLFGTTSSTSTGTAASPSSISATPSRAKTIDYLTVGGGASTSTPSGYTQHTPSRGLFSPNTAAAQQQQQQQQNHQTNSTSSSSASQESSFLLPSTGVSPGVNSNRASSPLARSGNASPQNLISDLFHPLPANQYKPTHPNHHHSHLLPELEAMTKRMKSTIRLPAAVTPLDNNNNNVDNYTTVNTNPLTSSSSSPAKSTTTMNNNNNNKFVKSPSTEDLTEEIASKTNNNSTAGATAGAFGKPYDRNDLVTTPPQHFSNGTNIFHHTIVFDLDETLCHNRGPGRAVLRPGAVELLRELAAIKRQLKQEHDKMLQQVSSVVTNYNGGSSINNNNNNKMNPNIRSLEIVLWTASMDDVAEPVIRRLDPNGDVFDHLIFRDSRWFRNESNYTKDLRLLGRDFGGIVIVENSPVSVRLNRQNSILVKDFVGQSYNDNDLFAVKEVLLNWISGNEKHFTPIDKFLKNCPLMDPKTNYVKATAGISTSSNNNSSTFSLGGSKYSNHHAAGGIRW